MMKACGVENSAQSNPGLVLGAAMGQAALAGRDKLTLIADPELEPLLPWIEQLVAESSGKSGRGILPVYGEPLNKVQVFGKDRFFVYIRDEGSNDRAVSKLINLNQPCFVIDTGGKRNLPAEFYRWEIATAVACSIIRVNAFDQPDVQDNKVRTQRIINDINVNGRILDEKPQWTDQRFHVFSQSVDWLKEKEMVRDIIRGFIAQGRRGDYVSIMTYLPNNERIMKTVGSLRDWIYESSNLATTVGFGPAIPSFNRTTS